MRSDRYHQRHAYFQAVSIHFGVLVPSTTLVLRSSNSSLVRWWMGLTPGTPQLSTLKTDRQFWNRHLRHWLAAFWKQSQLVRQQVEAQAPVHRSISIHHDGLGGGAGVTVRLHLRQGQLARKGLLPSLNRPSRTFIHCFDQTRRHHQPLQHREPWLLRRPTLAK